jgi:hypothetical protein
MCDLKPLQPSSKAEAFARLQDITDLAELWLEGSLIALVAQPEACRVATQLAGEVTETAVRCSRSYLSDPTASNAASAGEWIYRAAAAWALAKNRMAQQRATGEVWMRVLSVWADSLEVAISYATGGEPPAQTPA